MLDITIDVEEEIYHAEYGITDVETAEVMALSIEAEAGNETPVEVYTTTRRIDAPTLTADGSEIYATTSVAVMSSVRWQVILYIECFIRP